MAAETTSDAAKIGELIARLPSANDEEGHSWARDLAGYKRKAMPFLIEGLKSPDAATRKWCARAMTNMVGEYPEYEGRHVAIAGGLPLLEALKSEHNHYAKWYLIQALGSIQPDAQQVIPVLVEMLKKENEQNRREIVATLGEFRAKGVHAKPALIEQLSKEDRWNQRVIISTLRKIGLDNDDLLALSRLDIPDHSVAAYEIFDELIEHPELEVEFLKAHPKLLPTLPSNHLALVELFSRKDRERDTLRTWILKQKMLPDFVRIDRDRGESYGYVMALPRKFLPGQCFPQRPLLVKFSGDTAEIGAFQSDPDFRVWFGEGLASVSRDGKCGYIDETGKIVIRPQFQRVENFSDGLAVIWEDGKAGYIRRDGSYLKKPQYDWAFGFKHRLGSVTINGKYGLIDTDGAWVMQPTTAGNLDPCDDGFIAMTDDGWYHRVDKKGKITRTSREIDWIDYGYLDKQRAGKVRPIE